MATGIPQERCPERKALSRNVADAISGVYAARGHYEKAMQIRKPDAGALQNALTQARNTQRAADRALREHIEQHGCNA